VTVWMQSLCGIGWDGCTVADSGPAGIRREAIVADAGARDERSEWERPFRRKRW